MKVAQKTVLKIVALLAVATCGTAAHAQTPYILGTWKFNAEASQFSGPRPQTHIRSYRLREDGVLIGVALSVGSDGTPQFLQFAAKPDGKDYPEFETQTAAQYLVDRTPPPRTYSESPTADDHRIKWVDKMGGHILVSGERWVSKDGKTMSFTVNSPDKDGKAIQQLFVFDRAGN